MDRDCPQTNFAFTRRKRDPRAVRAVVLPTQRLDPDAVHRAAHQPGRNAVGARARANAGSVAAILVAEVGDVTHGEFAALPGNIGGQLLARHAGLHVGGRAGF